MQLQNSMLSNGEKPDGTILPEVDSERSPALMIRCGTSRAEIRDLRE
jgi:hypothetical protein